MSILADTKNNVKIASQSFLGLYQDNIPGGSAVNDISMFFTLLSPKVVIANYYRHFDFSVLLLLYFSMDCMHSYLV